MLSSKLYVTVCDMRPNHQVSCMSEMKRIPFLCEASRNVCHSCVFCISRFVACVFLQPCSAYHHVFIWFLKTLFGNCHFPSLFPLLRTASSPLPPYMYQQCWRDCNKTKTEQAETQATAQLLMILQG